MKRFKFRLQKVLEHRSSIEEDRKIALALRNAELLEAEQILQKLLIEQESVVMREGVIITAEELHQLSNYAGALRERIANQREIINERREAVLEAQAAYIAAKQDREVLEKVKIRQKEEHEKHIEKEQEKFLDELTVMRSGRKNS